MSAKRRTDNTHISHQDRIENQRDFSRIKLGPPPGRGGQVALRATPGMKAPGADKCLLAYGELEVHLLNTIAVLGALCVLAREQVFPAVSANGPTFTGPVVKRIVLRGGNRRFWRRSKIGRSDSYSPAQDGARPHLDAIF